MNQIDNIKKDREKTLLLPSKIEKFVENNEKFMKEMKKVYESFYEKEIPDISDEMASSSHHGEGSRDEIAGPSHHSREGIHWKFSEWADKMTGKVSKDMLKSSIKEVTEISGQDISDYGAFSSDEEEAGFNLAPYLRAYRDTKAHVKIAARWIAQNNVLLRQRDLEELKDMKNQISRHISAIKELKKNIRIYREAGLYEASKYESDFKHACSEFCNRCMEFMGKMRDVDQKIYRETIPDASDSSNQRPEATPRTILHSGSTSRHERKRSASAASDLDAIPEESVEGESTEGENAD